MALSIRTISITGSLVLSALFIAAAFILTSPLGRISVADAGPAEELLKEYAAKDTDADGLPDWQETLYRTNPTNPRSVDAGMTDKEAVAAGLVKPAFVSTPPDESVLEEVPGVDAAPGTLTDQFTRDFYTQYLTTRGTDAPSSEAILSFVEGAVAELEAESQKTPTYTMNDLADGGSGTVGLTTYASRLRDALNGNSPTKTDKDALEHFSDFVNGKNDNALVRVRAVGTAYRNTTLTLAKIPVPTELRYAHLQLLNSYDALASATLDMGKADSDPLLAFLGLKRYANAHTATAKAALDIGNILIAGIPQN